MVGPHILAQVDGRPPTRFTRGFLGMLAFLQERQFPISRVGDIAAIAIASLGFLIVNRFPPDRAQRGVLILVAIAWSLQAALLMTSLVALASPFATR